MVYLYFDTNDGAESAPKEYEIGSVIGKLGHTYKDGYMFMGWFYDGGFTLPVLETDTINNNTTIYACFSNETSGTIKKIGSVKNISRNPNVLIKSDVLLNNSNINDYISCENTTGNKVEIICKPGAAENSYIIAPFESFNPGEIYIIKSLKGNNKILMIDDEQVDGADEVSLTIYREEKEIIERKNSTHITYNDLINIEEDIYTYLDDGLEKTVNRLVVKKALDDIDFLENTILTIGNTNKKSDDDYTCKIISASLQELQFVIGDTIQKGEYWVLDIVTPNVDDLYDELDVFLTGEIELEEYVNLTSEEIIQNIKNHEGIVRLKNSITKALPATKTIDGYVSSLASQAEQEAFLDLLAKMEIERPIVKIKINGTKLAFSVKVSFGMQIKNFKLDVTIEIENETSIDYSFAITKSGKITLNPLLWFYTNLQINLANDFSIKISAEVSFGEKEDPINDIKNAIDITNEIEEILDESKDGYNKFAESITGSPFFEEDGSDLEYVDIFNIPLGKIPIPVPIISLQLDFNVVASIGAKAGLYIDFSHHYVESTTFANGHLPTPESKPVMYDSFNFNRTTTESEIDLAITLKGQIGFRCGLEAKLSLSVLGFNDIASVYVSFRFGPYIEISGLVSFRYTYDAVNKVGATQLQGGIYLEVGLFINAKIGTHFLKFDVNADIFDHKIALYDVGERLIPLKFEEESNTEDAPYKIYKRYSGVNITNLMMEYLDITNGERVIDRANNNQYGYTYDYEIEFVDMPGYQTDGYQDYVTLADGCRTLISRNFPLKSLKYVVRITLKPKKGVLTTNVSRIVYMEYYNPEGRDLIESTQTFVNEYKGTYGSKHYEIIESTVFTEGEYVIPPVINYTNMPSRHGYYLDLNDLWERYYPGIGKVDEEWDKVFPKITFDNTQRGVVYRLKWKVKTYSLKLYTPVFLDADTIQDYELQDELEMNYIPSLRAFLIKTDVLKIKTYFGKSFVKYQASNGLELKNDYFNVDTKNDGFADFDYQDGFYLIMHVDDKLGTFLNGFNDIEKELSMYATYDDVDVRHETYVLRTSSIQKTIVTYKSYDHQNSEGKALPIRPLPPEEYAIGKTFIFDDKEYIITGYQDLNPAPELIDKSIYKTLDDMPDVNKNRIYYVLFERKDIESVPVRYIHVYANGIEVASYGIKEGEAIDYDLLKINVSDEVIVGALVGCPSWKVMKEVCDNAKVIWPNREALPENMPKSDLICNVTCEYTFKLHTIKFVLDNATYKFTDDLNVIEEDGKLVYVIQGRPWVQGADNSDSYYSMPLLNNYYDFENNQYYVFKGWVDENQEFTPINVAKAFIKDTTYTPRFEKAELAINIYFINYTNYNDEYYYYIASGNYLGKTLSEVLKMLELPNPTRGDAAGKYAYEFIDWGVTDDYIIGSETDINGNIKTTLTFKARYKEEKQIHHITLKAGDGKFSNGDNTYVISGAFDEEINLENAIPLNYKTGIGEFVFAYFTKLQYDKESRVDLVGTLFGTTDETYYAYYTLNPEDITLKFYGKVKTESSDGTGIVYFNDNIEERVLEVTQKYGSVFYITANMFKVDSKSKTYLPDYLRWKVNGKEYISEFYNDNYMASIPFDVDADVEIVFKTPFLKNVNITFSSEGFCYELDGTKIEDVYCKGFMSGFRHIANLNMEYGTVIDAPMVSYYNENNYVFSHWETVLKDGTVKKVYQGEKITFTDDCDFYAVYVHDTTKDFILYFNAENHYSSPITDENFVEGLMIFKDNSTIITVKGKYDELITIPFEPICKGYNFIGWTTDGVDFISKEEMLETKFTHNETYYAVYEKDLSKKLKVTLHANNGQFSDNTDVAKLDDVYYGRLANTLLTPTPNDKTLVFSHYADVNGYPITTIENDIDLYAVYGKPIMTIKELQAINKMTDGNYVLMNDIILRNSSGELEFIDWAPLGSTSNEGFTGIFNGNGHAIVFGSKTKNASNFGLFSKVNGMVYNVFTKIQFELIGSTNEKSVGAFINVVGKNAKIINCTTFNDVNIIISASSSISASAAIGENYGLIDGLFAGTRGTIEIETDGVINVGNIVGTNYGTIRNVSNTGRMGALAVSLTRSIDANIGAITGSNNGKIENSFSERNVHIVLSRGNNIYRTNSVKVGGIVGINSGVIENCTVYDSYLEMQITNMTIGGVNYTVYKNENNGNPYYSLYKYVDDQGGMLKMIAIVYLNDDAKIEPSESFEQYHLSDFIKKYPDVGNKLNNFNGVILFEKTTQNIQNGKVNNINCIEYSTIGTIDEIVANCSFDELQWTYLARLYDNNYRK